MAGLAELAAVMMDVSRRRIEMTAANVTNVNTPGFRARRVFQTSLAQAESLPATTVAMPRSVGTPTFKATGNPLDIAVSPPATLILREADRLFAANTAQLRRDGEGRLVDSLGRVLQSAGGGDLTIGAGSPAVQRDGTILIDGRPEARIGLFTIEDSGGSDTLINGLALDAPLVAADDATLQSGTLIASNVDLAVEMIELTQAGRSAETGAKIFQIYDELLGKAASTLAGTAR